MTNRMGDGGCKLRLYGSRGGQLTTVCMADKVRLHNGLTGQVHSWTARGVAVMLDEDCRPEVGGMPVWALVCGDGDIDAITQEHPNKSRDYHRERERQGESVA